MTKKSILFVLCGMMVLKTYGQYQFLAPQPGSVNQNRQRCVIIREGHELDPDILQQKNSFIIHGSKSGNHDFTLELSNDHKTVILKPLIPFNSAEEVTVRISDQIKRADGMLLKGYEFNFYTHPEYDQATLQAMRAAVQKVQSDEISPGVNNSTRSVQSSPIINITVNTNPGPGDVFYDYQEGFPLPGSLRYTGCYIIQSSGDSLYSHHGIGVIADFKINHNGYLTFLDENSASFKMYDSSYHYMRSFSAVDGYSTDVHEFQIYPDGHYYLIGDDPEIVDMTKYNAHYRPTAIVVGSVIQEFDAGDHLIFEWRSFDHIDVTEALHEDLAASYIDYVHTNSIDEDVDGNIVVSHRHLDQVNKIDVHSGDFIWRLGGVKNQFSFINDPLKFNYQHDARLLPNGHLSLFDNGNYNPPPAYSYAKEYVLNPDNKTVTLIWSYSHPEVNGIHVFGTAMGSVQRFPNGGTFINWGWIPNGASIPNLTELDSSNQIVWEAKITPGFYFVTYRAYRLVWTPCARVSDQTMNTVNITSGGATIQWSDATNSVSYQVQYRDSSSAVWQSLNLSSSDTSFTLTNLSPATVYEWRIQSYCSAPDPDSSSYSAIRKFTTLYPTAIPPVTLDEFTIFPNPAGRNTILSLPLSNSSYRVLLMNDVGTILKTMNVSEKQVELNLDGLADGIYFVQIVSGEKIAIRKLMIEN